MGVVHLESSKVLGRGIQHSLSAAASSSSSAAAGGDDPVEASVESLSFCPDAPTILATGGSDGRVCVWEVGAASASGTGALRSTLLHPAGVTALAWRSAGGEVEAATPGRATFRGLFTACSDGVLRLWDSRAGVALRAFEGHGDMVLCLAVSRVPGYGHVAFSGGDDHVVKVWDVKDEDVDRYERTGTM